MGFAVVASAGAGAGAAGARVAGARVAGPVALTTCVLRGGGATGEVAMTWISGSFAALELEASCAATVLGAIARAIESAQSDPWSGMIEAHVRSAKPKSLPMCSLQHERVFVYNEDACHFSHLNIRLLRSSKRRIPHVENDVTFPHHCTRAKGDIEVAATLSETRSSNPKRNSRRRDATHTPVHVQLRMHAPSKDVTAVTLAIDELFPKMSGDLLAKSTGNIWQADCQMFPTKSEDCPCLRRHCCMVARNQTRDKSLEYV